VILYRMRLCVVFGGFLKYPLMKVILGPVLRKNPYTKCYHTCVLQNTYYKLNIGHVMVRAKVTTSDG